MPRKPLEKRLEEYNGDPLALYEAEHLGVPRTALQRKDSSLYNRLSKDGLLHRIRTLKHEIGPDTLDHYKKHYRGVTRHQLKKDCPGLHRRMREEGLLKHVPLADRSEVERGKAPWGYEPLKFYRENYHGLTRSELEKVEPGLATRLRVDGLMKYVPKKDLSEVAKKRSRYGSDALAYYNDNYEGLTVWELAKACPGLYKRLRKDDLLEHVPRKYKIRNGKNGKKK